MSEGWPSKRKYITLNVTFFAALAVFIATFAVVMLYKPGAPTAADLDLLTKGMTQAQVTTLLGEPKISVRSTIVAGDPEEVWTYALPPSHWSVTKTDYQLKFYEGRLDTWWKVK